MSICFCLNNLGSFGLGATLSSLIQNCSDSSQLRIYFLCSSVCKKIKKAITEIISQFNYKGEYTFIDFNPYDHFTRFRSLQNDWTPYGRLLIPDLINEKKILYLDTDLLVETDILELSYVDLKSYAIAAVDSTIMKYALENIFYIQKLGLDPYTKTFNSGVILLNLEIWKHKAIKDLLLEIGNLYPDELLAADQTLLNAFFKGNFFSLNDKYNIAWYPQSMQKIDSDAIFHFVGSPKPWDYFGKHIHSGYHKWKQYNPSIWQKNVLNQFQSSQFKRMWTIRRSYLKAIFKQ